MDNQIAQWVKYAETDLSVAKYPNELFLEERHAKQAIQYAEEVLNWVKN